MTYNQSDIENFETRFKSNLINSIGGFKSIVLIGTKSLQNNNNLALFSSLFHIGANPAYCGLIIRPNKETQNTLGNIINTQQFTINHILPTFYKQAHQCSAKYEEGISEFDKVGLTPEFIDLIKAPFVAQSKIKFACEFVQKINIELNNTTLIIGKIIKIIVPENYILSDGFIDLEKAETITCIGLDSYHTTNKLSRLSYAKVDKEINEI